jgi:hypothetical protein
VVWCSVEGKVMWRELSETITPRRMRDSGKEGRVCGQRIKTR